MVLFSSLILLWFGVLGIDGFQSLYPRGFGTDSFNRLSASAEGRSRRDLLVEAGGVALSSLVLGLPLPALAESGSSQTIVVTGANSGIGFEACKRLAQQGHTLVLACRTITKSLDTAERLKESEGNLIPAECDLANLASIKAFAEKLPSLIGNAKLDSLCLNAGMARNTGATDVARTADGFELTGKSCNEMKRTVVAFTLSLTRLSPLRIDSCLQLVPTILATFT
jgi:hypothetical protein